MRMDPVETNPELYHVVFENDRVRVLEYRDVPGDSTTPHRKSVFPPADVQISARNRQPQAGRRTAARRVQRGMSATIGIGRLVAF